MRLRQEVALAGTWPAVRDGLFGRVLDVQFDLGWVALNVRPGDVFLQVEFEGAVGRGDVERVYVTLFKDHVVGGWGCGCAVLGCVIRGGSDRRCVVWSISSVCGRHWRDSRKQQGNYHTRSPTATRWATGRCHFRCVCGA